jgi:hypothetical protein
MSMVSLRWSLPPTRAYLGLMYRSQGAAVKTLALVFLSYKRNHPPLIRGVSSIEWGANSVSHLSVHHVAVDSFPYDHETVIVPCGCVQTVEIWAVTPTSVLCTVLSPV